MMKTKRNVLLSVLGIATALILTSCGPQARRISAVEVTTDSAIMLHNYAKSGGGAPGLQSNMVVYLSGPSLFCVITDDDSGDVCFLYLYLPEDGNKLDLRVDGNLLWVNGKVQAISMDANHPGNFADWYAAASPSDLKSIRAIISDGDFEQELKAISSANPHVMIFDNDGGILFAQQPLFFMSGDSSDTLAQVSKIEQLDFTETRILMLEDCEDEIADVLSNKAMPNLHRLILMDSPDELYGLLDAFPHIKALTVIDAENSPNLGSLENLEELAVATDTAIDFNQLPHPEALRILILGTDNALGLEKLTNLEYLNPGEKALTAEDLASILATHPALTCLNLYAAQIESLEPLRKASNLEGVILCEIKDGTELDFTPLGDMKNLRYIGITGDTSPEITETLQEICPQALIYTYTPCLGSGWLALFIPLLLIILLIKKHRNNAYEGA